MTVIAHSVLSVAWLLLIGVLTPVKVAAMTESVPFQLAMMLGRSYNMATDRVGVDVFREEDTSKALVENDDYASTKYAIVLRQSDVRKIIDISSELSMKAKAGIVDIGPIGTFLKTTRVTNYDPVELVIFSFCHTTTQTLHGDLTALDVCATEDASMLGTHYLRSIQYGGVMAAAIRIYPGGNMTRDDILKRNLERFGSTGDLSASVDKFEELERAIAENRRIEIQTISTSANAVRSPQTISELLAEFGGFCDATRRAKERGVALRGEMFPLRSLPGCRKLPAWKRNFGLVAELDDFEDRFDDVLSVRSDIDEWLSHLPSDPDRISDTMMSSISQFSQKIKSIERVFYETVSHLDISMSADTAQLDTANDFYYGDGLRISRRIYSAKWKTLKNEIEAGSWCDWKPWERCSATCGGEARQWRSRQCSCPTPLNDNRSGCQGDRREARQCDVAPCPTPPPIPVEQCEQSKTVNKYDGEFTFKCPNNGIVKGLYSVFDKRKGDRRWSFGCCFTEATKDVLAESHVLKRVNWYTNEVDARCHSGYYLSGLESYHSNWFEDRRWTFYCTRSKVVQISKKECVKMTTPINLYKQLMEYKVPDGWLITGLKSRFYNNDRAWYVYRCPYTKVSVRGRTERTILEKGDGLVEM